MPDIGTRVEWIIDVLGKVHIKCHANYAYACVEAQNLTWGISTN